MLTRVAMAAMKKMVMMVVVVVVEYFCVKELCFDAYRVVGERWGGDS